MPEPLDERYFKWLYGQVDTIQEGPSYWDIARLLYKKEFVWTVPNDDNRGEDGRELRREFVNCFRIRKVDENWLTLGCSMLELLIALARRLDFETGDDPVEVWFWVLMENIGLGNAHDARPLPAYLVDEALDRVIWRTYDPTGRGGLFPLKRPKENQQQVEIWYQKEAYLLERRYY